MFMVDLAVPRDIEIEVKALEDVYLYTVDDLAGVVQTAQANRQAAVAQAEAIVDAGVQNFLHWLEQRATPCRLIQQLNAQADEWRAPWKLPGPASCWRKGEDVDAVLEALSRGLTQKMLHGAMAELRAGDAVAARTRQHRGTTFFLAQRALAGLTTSTALLSRSGCSLQDGGWSPIRGDALGATRSQPNGPNPGSRDPTPNLLPTVPRLFSACLID
jgi:hypothetical protein